MLAQQRVRRIGGTLARNSEGPLAHARAFSGFGRGRDVAGDQVGSSDTLDQVVRRDVGECRVPWLHPDPRNRPSCR
jgi:hypothetical protein